MSTISELNNIQNSAFYECKSCHIKLTQDQIQKCSRCKSVIYCGKECQIKDWKETHKIICIDFTKTFTDENIIIRDNFSNFKKLSIQPEFAYLGNDQYNHVLQTQRYILEGSGLLDPNKSIVVVCGAQFYDDKFIEPLPQLLERCNKLVLVDIDPITLEKLHRMLNGSTKVSTVVLDFTCSVKNFSSFYENLLTSTPEEFINNSLRFLEKVNVEAASNLRSARLPGVLAEFEEADYVISSLVASQLSVSLRDGLFSMFKKKFNASIFSFLEDEVLDKFFDVLNQVTDTLVIKHVENLSAWAGRKGRVYLADTYSYIYQSENIELVSDVAFDKITSLLKKRRATDDLTFKQWHWVANKDHDYTVKAIF